MLIKSYQFILSALLGHCCRFEPSCSRYAIQAIQHHGWFKGCYYAVRRLLRCHPWHRGGMDSIP